VVHPDGFEAIKTYAEGHDPECPDTDF